jgi:pimeloyl-ACP methyl ester carboxylesterase
MMMLRASPVGAAAALRGRAERPDYSLLLRELQMPALVIAGEHDQYSPGPVTQQLIDSLQHPDVLLMPGCGHLPNLEDPERFNAGVLAFMNVRG